MDRLNLTVPYWNQTGESRIFDKKIVEKVDELVDAANTGSTNYTTDHATLTSLSSDFSTLSTNFTNLSDGTTAILRNRQQKPANGLVGYLEYRTIPTKQAEER